MSQKGRHSYTCSSFHTYRTKVDLNKDRLRTFLKNSLVAKNHKEIKSFIPQISIKWVLIANSFYVLDKLLLTNKKKKSISDSNNSDKKQMKGIKTIWKSEKIY